ncbi:methyl-accepting chemotaxis protein [Evansella sp. AB-rgal1]|uniref:methyl-accepting chemotaxis protein n=1 Tax=Evansella sp. AB-rgal1 TaxID=3242696 RepID=UPI00359F004A
MKRIWKEIVELVRKIQWQKIWDKTKTIVGKTAKLVSNTVLKWEGKLVQKLTLLMACIFLVSAISGIYIFYSNQQVANKSVELDAAADLQQQYTTLVSDVKQIGIIKLLLVNSGYDQNRMEALEQALVEYERNFEEITNIIEDNSTLEHLFSHFGEAFRTYEQLYDRHFEGGFSHDDQERIRARVTPHVIRTEDSINQVDDRIRDYLLAEKQMAQSEMHQSIGTSTIAIILVCIFMVLIPLLFLGIFGKNISSGVKLVMERIRAYQEGNLLFHQKESRRDEFHDIDVALGAMGNSMHELFESNEKAANNVSHVSEETSRASKEQFHSMENLQGTVLEFSKELDQQADFTSSISAVTQEVSASSEQMQSSIEFMKVQVEDVGAASSEGVELLKGLQTTMRQLSGNTEEASSKVGKMAEQLNEIEAFIKGIDNIATQTNLLALNATIEAARAGAAGRSFSVVADEIRKLSAETNQFSNSTKEILASLSQDTYRVVEAFEVFRKQSDESLEKTNEASNNFLQISSSTNQVVSGYTELTAAVNEINRAMEDVVGSVSQLVDGATSLQRNNNHFKGIMEEQTQRQKELSQLTSTLNETAQSLKKRA